MELALFIIVAVPSFWYAAVIILFRVGLSRLTGAGAPANNSFSIIIAARNEAATIGPCLESVFGQTIAADRYEVIVVNDRSTDGTASVVEQFCIKHANLVLLSIDNVPDGAVPKKNAIAAGLARAHNEIIVLTDADCRVGPAWLDTIDRYCTGSTGLIQGLTAYHHAQGIGALLYGFQSVDFFSHGVVSACAIGANLPLNANANNMAFRRKAYDDVGGYGNESGVVSGDDDLLLQRIWRSGTWKVACMADKAGAVETRPTMTWRGLLEQRKRWGSITVHYSPLQTALLAGVFLFYCAIPALPVLSFINSMFLAAGCAMLGLKIAGEYLLMIPATKRIGRGWLLRWVAVSSLPQLFLVLYAVFFGVFGRFVWKEQPFGRIIGGKADGTI